MTPKIILASGPAPPAMSVEWLVPTKLLSEKSSAKVENSLPRSNMGNLSARAVTITSTLRTFEGYSHHGINE
jgi:hypothetical protein